MKRVVIIAGQSSYRTGDFLAAASLLRIEAFIAGDGSPQSGATGLVVSLDDPIAAARAIADRYPAVDAVVAIDDQGVLTAAHVAAILDLPQNPPQAVAATRDKALMRRRLVARGVTQPDFRTAAPGFVAAAAGAVGFPAVIKPTTLAASRGVIRVDDAQDAAATESRVRSILKSAGVSPTQDLLVEEFIPGDEVVVEGILSSAGLEVLAIIDKPDPLQGPYFEETLYVTPSRHDPEVQAAVVAAVEDAVSALGLVAGPIHAEVRIDPQEACYLIEVAARSIGGLCGRALSFGLLGESLEVIVLRSALGISSVDTTLARPATGVLMLPIPATGTLTGVAGLGSARSIPGIDDITITVPTGRRVVALPEGDRYLGFVFAGGADPEEVETALRRAGTELAVTIDGEEVRPPTPLSRVSDCDDR